MNFTPLFTLITFVYFFSTTLIGMDTYHSNHQELFAYATEKKWDSFQQSLSEYNGSLNLLNSQGYSLVHIAVCDNHKKSLVALIEKGASVDLEDHKFNNTPLHLAAWFNYPDIISVLVTAQANLTKINTHGSTPVHSAAWRNNSDSLIKLLECGASAVEKNTTGEGNTPLYLAAKAGSINCVQILLRYLYKELPIDQFLTHLNQQCSGDYTTAIQAAGIRRHTQCYWDLVIAGGNYLEKSHNQRIKKDEFISETINDNNPVKSFIEAIEANGKNNPPRYNSNGSPCCMCNIDYKHNDVVMTLTLCDHSCHVYCFQDLVFERFINTNKGHNKIQNEPLHETKHRLRTNPFLFINWKSVNGCPECTMSTVVDRDGKLSVFLDEKEAC
jgi:ankyrin repeat protein